MRKVSFQLFSVDEIFLLLTNVEFDLVQQRHHLFSMSFFVFEDSFHRHLRVYCQHPQEVIVEVWLHYEREWNSLLKTKKILI